MPPNSTKRRDAFGGRPGQAKRRRAPSPVPSSSCVSANVDTANGTTSTTPPSTVPPILPQLATIPRLVMEDMMKDNPKEVAKAMEELSDLLDSSDHNHEQNTREAFRFGAQTMVLAQMRRWKDEVEVQVCGCFCVEKLAFLDEFEPQVIDAGGVETVLTNLQKYPASLDIQYAGCRALKNMLSGNPIASTSTQKISHRFVQELGGVRVVQRAMETFAEDEEVQSVCCDIYRFLALKKQFRTAMLEARVGDVVMKMLEKYWNKDPQVKEKATRCMENLFSKK